jgi:hypothetical protein
MHEITAGQAKLGRRLRFAGAQLNDQAAVQPSYFRWIDLLTLSKTGQGNAERGKPKRMLSKERWILHGGVYPVI